jgi:hypothetical protein
MANVHIDIGICHHPQPVPITMQQPRCLINVTLQRYLAGWPMDAPFPVREIGSMIALLHLRHQPQDVIHIQDFERQDHIQ